MDVEELKKLARDKWLGVKQDEYGNYSDTD